MKRLEHVEAAKAEALKLGASITFKYDRKHIIATICIDNVCRKLSMSKTPSGMCVYHVIDDVRRLIRRIKG